MNHESLPVPHTTTCDWCDSEILADTVGFHDLGRVFCSDECADAQAKFVEFEESEE